jgi:D-alanine-D-alanine ligase-like ATP-grasp enzyme
MSKARVKLSTLILLAMAGCAAEREVSVSMDEIPTPVRATLDRERMGGQVLESEKEVKNGKTVYSFDVTINGKAYDVDIAEDGALLAKKLDDGPESDPREGSRRTDYNRDLGNSAMKNERK